MRKKTKLTACAALMLKKVKHEFRHIDYSFKLCILNLDVSHMTNNSPVNDRKIQEFHISLCSFLI